jgi:hypothetical protein
LLCFIFLGDYFVLKRLSHTKIINFPKSQMERITKSRASSICRKRPRTIIRGESNSPIPARMPTAMRKSKPIAKAFILGIIPLFIVDVKEKS